MAKYPYDILLAGIGIGGPRTTTQETVDLLRRARVVYSLSIHKEFVSELCDNVIDLDDDFYTGEDNEKVYARLATDMLDEAGRAGGVALVDDGHPLIYDDANRSIVRRGKRRGLRVIALPAISFLDAMITQWDIPVDARGLQLLEANSVVLYRQQLNPTLETLILQLGWFGTSLLVPIEAHTAERFRPFRDYLLRFYPPAHRVTVVRASQRRDRRPDKFTCRLDRLDRQYRRIPTDCTLHIPALDDDATPDAALLATLTDQEHLERIARL